MKQRGLTLIELLIAMAVTVVIGIAGATMLNTMIRNQGQISERGQDLEQLQRSLQIMQSDLEQMVLHRDLGQHKLAPNDLITSGSSRVPGLLLEFTRLQSLPELEQPHFTQTRVRYLLEGDQLMRASSPVALPADDHNWFKQSLLAGISKVELGFYHERWSNQLTATPVYPLQAIRLRLESKRWQIIELVSQIPAGGA